MLTIMRTVLAVGFVRSVTSLLPRVAVRSLVAERTFGAFASTHARRAVPPGALCVRRPGMQTREVIDLPKMNEEIMQPELRVLVDRGEMPDEILGVITRAEALARAAELGVDLVLIANSDPPVCKIVDYGKLRYQKDKKKKEQAKKSKSNEIKELKMSYKIGEADYQVRRRAASKFIENGNRVKLSVQFRGREQQHINLGDELIAKFIADVDSDGILVSKTKTVREGRDLTTILSAKS
ncbi:translation initiation factor IF-3, N-terminal domain-containing protein [Pelagophyceae sp. CCMP2097]|nr:translation initiation factor IF-3, N-terminal domain-containing protein [Pelagophyceae sp. CCMP2097]